MPEAIVTGHDLVNRLEAENARLTAALELIASETYNTQYETGAPTWRQTSRWHNIARRAVEPLPDEPRPQPGQGQTTSYD